MLRAQAVISRRVSAAQRTTREQEQASAAILRLQWPIVP